MIAANAALPTVVLAFLALLAVLMALLARRALSQVGETAHQLAGELAGQASSLPRALDHARGQLMTAGTATERGLWSLGQFDGHVVAATAELAERRIELDNMRARLQQARSRIESVKSGVQMLIRAIELRRTILG